MSSETAVLSDRYEGLFNRRHEIIGALAVAKADADIPKAERLQGELDDVESEQVQVEMKLTAIYVRDSARLCAAG